VSELYQAASQELEAGRDLCLATIVNQIGSAPRELGTSFFVRADGTIHGTIGGGRLEAEVIEAAALALEQGASRLLHFRLRGTEVAETDMLCGGDVDVYLEPVRAADAAAREIMGAAARLAARGGRALVATPLEPGPLPTLEDRKLLVAEEFRAGGLERAPGLADELAAHLAQESPPAKPSLWMHQLPDGGKLDCFLEPILSRPRVYLFGGGHVCLPLAQVVKMLGFALTVVDDRPEFANRRRFPQADEVEVRDFARAWDQPPGPDSYLVIITRGHVYDKEVLAQALRSQARYVGMIGSRRKRALIYQKLLEEGFSQADLDRVHSPIGLDIGAETPEEIAVSIAAELVQVRAGLHPKRAGGPGV
jgi:xanthine dehydrogenase accessory factor